MALVDAAELADARDRSGIAQRTTQRVARVGRVRDDPTFAQDHRCLAHEARLRMRCVNSEELSHWRPGLGPRG